MAKKRTTPTKPRAGGRKPTTGKKAEVIAKRKLAGETPATGPPSYDAVAVGRIARRINILTIELVNAQFERRDDGPLPGNEISDAVPELGLFVEWEVSDDERSLGCAVNFSATFDDEREPPYSAFARLRVIYLIEDGDPLEFSDIEQFVHWNAVFNAWPYWREILSSIISRAQLPRFIVPVMGVPRAS